MAFTAKDVQALREKTGVGMMDCKKALTASDGDMDKAVEFLREKGLAASEKKAGRIAAEGLVYAGVIDGMGIAVEVNSETDFVAKNADFQKFVEDVAGAVAANKPADVEALFACKYPGSDLTVEEMQREKILTIGENIKVRRFAIYEENVTVPYVHAGGKIGVLVNMEVSDDIKGNDAVVALGRDIAMQIAAMNPSYLAKDDVDPSVLEKEKEILMAQAMNEGKPQNIAEKMVMGRIGKFYSENCLLEQAFVKDDKVSVSKHVDAVAKELGGSIKVVAFTRFEKGEGIEKRVDNFAEEVASMAK
ncbi:MAG: elongation factor Ts [Clostridia bacterium]|nr:elongation factor Ts [Clostridia bacterium]